MAQLPNNATITINTPTTGTLYDVANFTYSIDGTSTTFKCSHMIDSRSILEYPDGLLVSSCRLCGDRVTFEFDEHSLLLRRAHEIAIAVVEASPNEAVGYVESYHRLKERVQAEEESLAEAKVLLERMETILIKKTKDILCD